MELLSLNFNHIIIQAKFVKCTNYQKSGVHYKSEILHECTNSVPVRNSPWFSLKKQNKSPLSFVLQ